MLSSLVAALCAVFIGSTTVGCSNEGEPGSCFRPRDNACVEYGRAQGAAGKRLCSGMTWTAGDKSCPSAGRLGTCVKKSGPEHLYGGAPNNYSPSSAKNACEWAGGVFTSTTGTSP
jgi:hypothetical protein